MPLNTQVLPLRGKAINTAMVIEFQRRTLTGTGRQKTVPAGTGKNPRRKAARGATTAINMAGFFDISQVVFFV